MICPCPVRIWLPRSGRNEVAAGTEPQLSAWLVFLKAYLKALAVCNER